MAREDRLDDTPLSKLMRSRRRPQSKPVAFPGGDGIDVVFWNPNDEEVAESAADATRYLKDELKLDEFQATLAMESKLYSAEEQRQLLSRVMRDAKDPDSPVGTIEDLREALGPNERDYLCMHLAAFIDERDPHKKENDSQKIVRRILDLKAAGDLSEYLTSCDFGTLRNIALSLADQLPTPTSPSSLDTMSSKWPSDIGLESTPQTPQTPSNG
jgi:hypothetical protein